ncbi:choice-of-anchor L domain-containing protein [Flaviramulus aquimarinus]|uniref:Choice-of-anchor L domain-containing protein n=1 Tax=Flaviramulus aquimarinus TaxID=1170456 RepID=A0ABP9FAQ3_9FLAO
MRSLIYIFIALASFKFAAQNIQVDSQTYAPQQLIEDILIDSNCINNVVVTNVIGGDFGVSDQSYGYFDATGTTFPFQRGIVLSTGRLSNVDGPNTTLSDDDAPNWGGDNDLETILDESNTHNATILEFDFIPKASAISFRYLFASEEYQQGNPNSCLFSDLFGFLIREESEQTYINIALVPDTQIPVKVTTVHPGIPGSCSAQNETYFGSWNDTTAPINFNGQTAVLTATANVLTGATYHVKLVIADEQNYRYDSAVFLEAGSFELSTDLGPNRLIATNNPVCENDTLQLNAIQPGLNSYSWYKDGVLVDIQPSGCSNCGTYSVTDSGTYNVEVGLPDNCISYGEITVEYLQNPMVNNSTIIECDLNQDGLTTYNLYDAEQDIINGDNDLLIENFYETLQDAESAINKIIIPTEFQNTISQQIIFARVENQLGCFSIAEVTLNISNNNINLPPFNSCDDTIIDGITDFNIADLTNHIIPLVPIGSTIEFYTDEQEAILGKNAITGTYTNTIPNSETIYTKIENISNCYAISTIDLNVIYTPILLPDETIYYCSNFFPQTISINAGVLDETPNNYTYQWLLNNSPLAANTSIININETGTYTVQVTNPNGCSSSRNIIIASSIVATITQNDITIIDFSDNNSVMINPENLGQGDYEYALRLENTVFINYQNEPFFDNLKTGFYTVFVNDKNGCGVSIPLNISIIGYPKYFTPNGDGINDYWQIKGISATVNPPKKILIFDRYGKLLKQLPPGSKGWNGTFKNNLLPTDGYWFKVFLEDGRKYSGHFTLKR